MKRLLLIALALTCFEIHAKVLVVPTAANTQGLYGAYFKTKLSIFPQGHPQAATFFPVTLQVLPPMGVPGVTHDVVVEQGRVTVFENVFETIGYFGGGGLQILYPENQTIIVSAEIYVDGPSGRYSTLVPVLDPVSITVTQTTLGVNNDALNRLNIGCSALLNPASVAAEFHRADGSLIETMHFSVPAYGWTQVAVPFSVTDGYILWGAYGYTYCYAVNVNNQTNDGTLLR